MTNCEEFINYVESLSNEKEMTEGAARFFEILKNSQDKFEEKELLTDSGKAILSFLKTQPNKGLKATDIGLGMGIPSRKVSGAMRKLVTLELVEKIGEKPIVYMISTKGLEYNIEGENN